MCRVHGFRRSCRCALIDTEVITMTVPAVTASIVKVSSSCDSGERLVTNTPATIPSATAWTAST